MKSETINRVRQEMAQILVANCDNLRESLAITCIFLGDLIMNATDENVHDAIDLLCNRVSIGIAKAIVKRGELSHNPEVQTFTATKQQA